MSKFISLYNRLLKQYQRGIITDIQMDDLLHVQMFEACRFYGDKWVFVSE